MYFKMTNLFICGRTIIQAYGSFLNEHILNGHIFNFFNNILIFKRAK